MKLVCLVLLMSFAASAAQTTNKYDKRFPVLKAAKEGKQEEQDRTVRPVPEKPRNADPQLDPIDDKLTEKEGAVD